jgi:molecular chaperone DnaK
MISREHLFHLTRDLVEKSVQISDQVLKDAKMSIDDIDEIVLVGGMSRAPFVHNAVHQHYRKKPYGDVNPDEAVALGAALLGGELAGAGRVSLVDVLSMSIGIALPKNRFKPILMKNTPVPCQRKYKISADLSADFTIDIFQGEAEKCNENEYLGTLVFSDEVKSRSMQRLEIEFDLNAECLLNCIIRNPESGKSEKALLITHDTPPSSRQN